jgi:hypothetical protein
MTQETLDDQGSRERRKPWTTKETLDDQGKP